MGELAKARAASEKARVASPSGRSGECLRGSMARGRGARAGSLKTPSREKDEYMGASIAMAKGASDAGLQHAVAVIGDSTFLHTGINGLLGAAAENTPLTVIICTYKREQAVGETLALLFGPKVQTAGFVDLHVILVDQGTRITVMVDRDLEIW
jgi:hypothetical protein